MTIVDDGDKQTTTTTRETIERRDCLFGRLVVWSVVPFTGQHPRPSSFHLLLVRVIIFHLSTSNTTYTLPRVCVSSCCVVFIMRKKKAKKITQNAKLDDDHGVRAMGEKKEKTTNTIINIIVDAAITTTTATPLL